ncbi:SPOSA6832_02080 [Sporobolomyces salmonicolor]|uniref:SPOSA6832_02080-mRNA-1:cds n=1 Tax=Sporidiobolus salmonicolor TaxID=5005 RepID=A0A0D6EKF6_SPOSA|nr:SPOSA6832_02080 [Sporobolomyces salmonicolor]
MPAINPSSATDLSALSAMYAVSNPPAAAQVSGETGLSDAVGSPAASTNTGKVVQKADRSCKNKFNLGHTVARPRFDSLELYPACARCRKRREDCVYSEGVYIETVEEGSDQAKIAELEAKVASLETRLKNASNGATTFPTPLPPLPAAATTLTRENLASIIGQTLLNDLSPKETTVLHGFLKEQDQSVLFRAQDLRSTANPTDVALTFLLLDASTRACCTRLPGLQLLRDRLPYYKANLHALDPPCQVVVVALCAVGARVIPNSALFGVPNVTFSDGTVSAQLFLAVGTRREKVCQALQATAIEASWASGVLRERNYDNLDSLLGLVQVLIHEEGRMQESRFFLRQVVGMFLDLRHEEMAMGVMSNITEATTAAIYLSDAFVSSTCNRPSFIHPADLDYFVTCGLPVPDLVNLRLSEVLEDQLGAPLSRGTIVSMLTTIDLHVLSCHRVFAQVSSREPSRSSRPVLRFTPYRHAARRPGAASNLPFLRNMWTVLDQIHNAIQRLQQHLVNLASPPTGYGDDPDAVNHAILLAIRADNSLVDLVMLIHVHLSKKRGEGSYWPDREGNEELERMRSESSMRVFKCLKLLAFYCQLYTASQDKHNIFHLLLRLEALPDWTSLVSLRIGAPGGPLTDEFEVTQEELDCRT